jgi:hypothetical protein
MRITRSRAVAVGVAVVVAGGAAHSAQAVRDRAGAAALTGRWERVNTCRELVRALTRYGLRPLAPATIAGNGYVPGTPRQIARRRSMCRGAVARRHSHFFRADGQFGSVDFDDRQVDDGPYRIADAHTVRIGRPPGEGTFRMWIEHGRLHLRPVISAALKRRALAHPLRFSTAGWMVSVAYPGGSWKRVPCRQWC